MSKTILTAILAALVAGLIVYFVANKNEEHTDIKVTVESIKNISELAVVEYTLSESLKRTLKESNPLIRDAIFYIYMKGVIKGSVNLELGNYDIDIDKRTANITFPKKAILVSNPSFDEEDIEFTTCKDRIFKKINDANRNSAIKAAIKAMKATAKENGIEAKVKKEAKLVIENYLTSLGYQAKVIFK